MRPDDRAVYEPVRVAVPAVPVIMWRMIVVVVIVVVRVAVFVADGLRTTEPEEMAMGVGVRVPVDESAMPMKRTLSAHADLEG